MNHPHQNLQLVSALPMTSHSRRDETDTPGTRLHGFWLVLARAAWIVMVMLSLAVSLADLSLEWRRLHTFCVGSSCGQQLTAGIVQDLHQLNLSVDFFANYILILEFGSLLVCVAMALLIFWRRSDELMA